MSDDTDRVISRREQVSVLRANRRDTSADA